MAFPTLFPTGVADPTNPSTYRDVPFAQKVKHLLKYGEKIDVVWYYRFASHPRFPYWYLKMIQRKRMLAQASMFLKQNPGKAHYSVEELQQMAEPGSARSLINKISCYSTNITGTHSYWHKLKDDLKAIILNA